MGEDGAPYTDTDRRKALILAAVLGWVGVTVLVLAGLDSSLALFLLPFFAFMGLPVSFVATFLIGGPIVEWLMRRSVGWGRAAAGGGLVAGIFAAVVIALTRLKGFFDSQDPNFRSQLGGGDFVIEVNGILTPYGWLLLAQTTALFVALGAVIGLLVRVAIGPGDRPA
ncbi:MAG TPA: hypothetical protein PKA03_07465 [Tabrizicola sp.]|nr:hypothetical protein [Tabrizicola sp.]